MIGNSGDRPLSPSSIVLASSSSHPACIDLIEWAEGEGRKALKQGKRLAFWQIAAARQTGVRYPERVRILSLDAMPEPNKELLQAALSAGLVHSGAIAMAFGYGILTLQRRIWERRLLSEMLRRVAEYEAAGSIAAFITGCLDGTASQWQAAVSPTRSRGLPRRPAHAVEEFRVREA